MTDMQWSADTVPSKGILAVTMWRLRWIPNAITYSRGIMTLFIGAIFLWEWLAGNPSYLVYALWFTVAAVCTDYVDGGLAKLFSAYGWRTDHGAIADPWMDKALALVVFIAIPVQCGLGLYLVVYVPAGVYIVIYSRITTRLRRQGLIDKASRQAQLKTALQMFVKVAFMFDIAWASTLPDATRMYVFGVALACFAFSALMCHWSLQEYTEQAKHKGTRPVAAE